MLCLIREKLTGVKPEDIILPLCLSAYADDIIVAVTDKNDTQKLTHITECFGKISSSKVNWDKSTALLVGKWRGNKPWLPNGFKWLTHWIKWW